LSRPLVRVVGLGPGRPGLVTSEALEALRAARAVFLRTARHPSAGLAEGAHSFDALYESASGLEEVYAGIVEAVVGCALAEAHSGGPDGSVVYAVPGSPTVAERSVELLRADRRVRTEILPAVSFADLAFERLGVDPLAAGVALVDGQRFAVEAAGRAGPLLVGQCDRVQVLSEVKLAIAGVVDSLGAAANRPEVTVLQRLGLPDEAVFSVPWDELDRCFEPDHLTSLWVPPLGAPFAAEMVRLEEIGRTLRRRCPWDRQQTHHSLTRYLLEEAYETLEAIEELPAGGRRAEPVEAVREASLAYEHLEEELGDVLFQVVFHSVLAAEEGQFTLGDVARRVHAKLVRRHPHVFGELDASTPEEVSRNWEQIKKDERGEHGSSLMDHLPRNLPALLYAHKVQARAASVGFDWPSVEGALAKVAEELAELSEAIASAGARDELGDLLFAAVNVARKLKLDPEAALREAGARFRRRFQAMEQLASARGLDLRELGLEQLDKLWDEVKATAPGGAGGPA
jgi:tetrapyrrole methylase family protein/MazG family protein